MTVTTSKTYQGRDLQLEVAILRLARAVNELTAAVDRLADKQHLGYQDDQKNHEEYQAILQSLGKTKRHLKDAVDTFAEA